MATSSSQRSPWLITLLVALIGAAGVVGAAVLPGWWNPGDGGAGDSDTTTAAPQVEGSTPGPPADRVGALHLEGEGATGRAPGLQLGGEGGIGYLSYISADTWAVYDSRALGTGEIRSITARVASDRSGGEIRIRLDGSNGPVIGECSVSGTGGWLVWQTLRCEVLRDTVSAPGLLHLDFTRTATTGENPYLFNLDWIEIS